MWTMVIVVVLPGLQFLTGIVQRDELVDVQALVAQPTVERLDQPVLRGLSRPDEIELDAASIGPLVERLGRELGAVVDGDRLAAARAMRRPVQGVDDARPVRRSWPPEHTLATPLIDHRQHPKRAAVEHLVVDKVHAPVLIRPGRRRRRAALQADALAPLDLHAHLQPFEAIQPVDALLVDRPAFALQHHQHAQVAEPWSLMAISRMRRRSAL